MTYSEDWFQLHKQSIIDRARVFSEYSSAEERTRIDQNVLSDWLRQFENEHRGLEAAWRLVERIDFFSRRRVQETVRHFVENKLLSEWPSDEIVIMPLGLPIDSSTRLLHDTGAIWMEYNMRVEPLESAINRDANVYVFIDDNIGSGKQACSILDDLLNIRFEERDSELDESRELHISSQASQLLRKRNLFFFSLLAFEEGIARLSNYSQRHQLKLRIANAKLVTAYDKVFAKNSAAFQDDEDLRIIAKNIFRDVGFWLTAEKEHWGEDKRLRNALGYGDAQTLFVFVNNVPTTTVTALWKNGIWNGKEYRALFPRREKKLSSAQRIKPIRSQHAQTRPVTKAPAKRKGRVSVGRLPTLESSIAHGRGNDALEVLNKIFAEKKHVVIIVGDPGTGKTALLKYIRDLLQQDIAGDNVHHIDSLFEWSFYGFVDKDLRPSSGQFLRSALDWYSGNTIHHNWKTSTAGETLGSKIREGKHVLLLDGLEVFQNPFNHPQPGRIKDPALRQMLRTLSSTSVDNNACCIITTRQPIPELIGEQLAYHWDLPQLNGLAARAILIDYKLTGGTYIYDEIAKHFQNHPLSLHLLGSHLSRRYRGDARKWKEISNPMEGSTVANHVIKILDSYNIALAADQDQHQLMRVVSLFDRPVKRFELRALCASNIPEVTDALGTLTGASIANAIGHLQDAHLLNDSPGYLELDTHPLIREYFRHQLHTSHTSSWQAANLLLADFYRSRAAEQGIGEVQLYELYTATHCFLRAGRVNDAYELYINEIHRSYESSVVRQLGLWGDDLALLSAYFEGDWYAPKNEHNLEAARFITEQSGTRLRWIGRIEDSRTVLQTVVEDAYSQKRYSDCLIGSRYVSECLSLTGSIKEADRWAAIAYEVSNQVGNQVDRIAARTILASTSALLGNYTKADALFMEAELICQNTYPNAPLLPSYSGFRHFYYLLSRGKPELVQNRAAELSQGNEQNQFYAFGSVDQALYLVSEGAAKVDVAIAEGSDPSEGLTRLDEGVAALAEADRYEFYLLGLFLRGRARRRSGFQKLALEDLHYVSKEASDNKLMRILIDAKIESHAATTQITKPVLTDETSLWADSIDYKPLWLS